jgi:hypothetical protein
MNTKNKKKTFLFILAGLFLVQAAFVSPTYASCVDECSYSGQSQEAGGYYRTCGNYDSDYCYEWSEWTQDTSYTTYTSTCVDE